MKNTNENTNVKKPFYKKWWFWAIVVVVALSAMFGSNEEENKTTTETPTAVETTENTATEEPKQEDKLLLELVGDEQGEYSTKIYFNKGSEDEISRYVQHIPAGTYKATNVGEYMGAIYVYSDEVHKTDAGFEEPAETFFGKTLDINASAEITIEDGQYIYIPKPGKFKLEQQ